MISVVYLVNHAIHLAFMLFRRRSDGCNLLFHFQGYLVFKEFCETQCDEPVPQLAFYEDVSERAFISYINLFIYLLYFPNFVQEAAKQPQVYKNIFLSGRVLVVQA